VSDRLLPSSFRPGCGCHAEIPAARTRNLLLLPDWLSEARGTESGEANGSARLTDTDRSGCPQQRGGAASAAIELTADDQRVIEEAAARSR
jgi:hypothetical protein